LNSNDHPVSEVKWQHNWVPLTKLKVSLGEAKTIKQDIRILLIGKLHSPILSSRIFNGNRPTIKKPTDFMLNEYFIYLKVKEIWIYNQITGKIYNKISM
jgi:hypothetical protein